MLSELPVESAINDSIQVLATPVLMIEVIRMLPEVDGEQTGVPTSLWAIQIRCGHDSHLLAAVGDQPKPPASQVRRTSRRELVSEAREVTERVLERSPQISTGAFLPRCQALEEKRVVPGVRGGCMKFCAARMLARPAHDL